VCSSDLDVSANPSLRREMEERSGGGYTVPQIFVDGTPIGGSDELAALEASGELNGVLQLA